MSISAQKQNFNMEISKNTDNDNSEEQQPRVVRTTADLQRLKLEKLMKNPEKPVIIPDRPKERTMANPPDFVRNVMGSSAGAGSGEFHVYRHLRRKEYARQKFIHERSEKERLDNEYHEKLEENKRSAEEKTAKKRAKRLKKKEKAKLKTKKPKIEGQNDNKTQSSEESDNSDDNQNEEPDNKNDDHNTEFENNGKSRNKERNGKKCDTQNKNIKSDDNV